VKFPHLRGMYWRYMLGTLSNNGFCSWRKELIDLIDLYGTLKLECLPNLDLVETDPLSQSAEGVSGNWKKYYEV